MDKTVKILLSVSDGDTEKIKMYFDNKINSDISDKEGKIGVIKEVQSYVVGEKNDRNKLSQLANIINDIINNEAPYDKLDDEAVELYENIANVYENLYDMGFN